MGPVVLNRTTTMTKQGPTKKKEKKSERPARVREEGGKLIN